MTVTLAALGVTDKQYTEYLENASNFNTRLLVERRLRLPYLDSQTGVAQSDCSLWMQKRHRMPGSRHGQLYTYPAKRWRRRRLPPFLQERLMKPSEEVVDADEHQITTVENMAVTKEDETTSSVTVDEVPKETWYKDYDELSDPPDAGEIEDADSDVDDYEDYSFRRKKKKPPPRSSGSSRKKKQQVEKEKTEKDLEMEKPFACEVCGARYKTRPGLTYHVTHAHQVISEHSEDSNSVPSPKVAPGPTATAQACSNARQDKIVSSDYCDFCLGDTTENKKTMQPEELVSCSDCGRSGHPTCLQFTDNMLISVKKYRWQCIECKSCGLCGTSDNDDQLLFCDDCDRGYHMYCLNPPLSEPPEGSWSCHLCLEEFGEKASVNQNQDNRDEDNSTMSN